MIIIGEKINGSIPSVADDVISYNCKNVHVKTKTGHEYSGRCHVHCELGDDDETMDEYVSIDGGLCIGIEDIAEITEIKD